MQRRDFLTLAGGATLGCVIARADPGATQPDDLAAPLRVRLFSGIDIVKLQAGGITLDAAAGTMAGAAGSVPIGSQVVALSANPYLDVVAQTDAGAALARRYPGTLFAQVRDGKLELIDQVDLETYVASVLSSEVSPGWPVESLRAQAIVVRTYATHARLARGQREYDVNDDTSSQVYRGVDALAQSLIAAANDTAGQIIDTVGVPATVFYSSSCGGHTASSIELSGLPAPPYLVGVSDLDPSGRAYCANAPYFRWTNSVTADNMARIVGVPSNQLSSMTVTQRWPDGRVKTVAASGASATITLDGRVFYTRALDLLGYKVIPSALFDITRSGDSFVLVGHGVGHGVGMCQWGAHGRADAGMSAGQIIQAYFPGTSLSRV